METEFTLNDMRQLIHDELQKILDVKHDEDKLLSRKQASEMLGIKSNTLAVWAMKGIGPAPTKVGAMSMYCKSNIKKYIVEQTMPR